MATDLPLDRVLDPDVRERLRGSYLESEAISTLGREDGYSVRYYPQLEDGLEPWKDSLELDDGSVLERMRGVYDPSLATLVDGRPSLTAEGYSVDFPLTEKEDGYLYRGLSAPEMEDILVSGRIRSKGGYNIGPSQEGTTSFATDPRTALSYANSFAPLEHKPSFGSPGYVVKVRDDSLPRADIALPDNEVSILGDVPAELIEQAIELQPYDIGGGIYRLTPTSNSFEPRPDHIDSEDWDRGFTSFRNQSPSVSVGYRDATDMVRQLRKTANILDPIHSGLDERVWVDGESARPKLRPEHREWITDAINETLDEAGYDGMEIWLSLVFTGSLTTYQYSEESDVDISLFVDAEVFPEWSRAEMIGIMVENMDGVKLPGTPFPMQCFVVPSDVKREELYRPGTRSGYDLKQDEWIVPPERSRAHDVEQEMNRAYTLAIENADKMDRLLRYEPDKAIQFYKQISNRRRRDMRSGKGDYSDSNISYKMLANRGYLDQVSEISGIYIA